MKNTRSRNNPYRYTQQFDLPFSFEQLYSYPEILKTKDYVSGKSSQRIGIIGGGIAGLCSAYELNKLGHKVTVLEASHRLGGRIQTHYFSDGTHSELGAMRIPLSHRCVVHYLEEFQLPKQPFVSYNPACFYYLRGQKTRLKEFGKLGQVYNLNINEERDPGWIYDEVLKTLVESLSEAEKWEMFSPTFSSDKLKEYDRTTFTQYFRDRLSPDAFELVGHATGMIHYDRVSLLGGLIDFFAWYHAEQYQLIGGMETLVKAFVERLSGKIQGDAKVTAIQMTDTGVRVNWDRLDSAQVQEFDYLICTIPTPALAKIEFNPVLPADKMQAIRSLGYSSAAKTLFHCKARPWELHDNIYGGGSFTDLPMEKCWYPSDNACFAGEEAGNPRWVAQDPEISHQPTGFTAAYRWESNARHFLRLEERERTDSTLQEIQQLHPQIEEYVDEVVHCLWDEESNPGSGAYAFFAPGEHERMQGLLCQPYPLDKPRVFFAGEHLAIDHASVQGAIQTAVSAVIDILQILT
ncbi:MAG: NAD(P)/FAD-dependent oxidoreductase [Oscillatoria sp. PMC 1068.18]|nr:NAD(P)/FAD-dependent oxidoreductase [Oscillatoria sp. PMC 1076.18]MEC4988745.1 NAD(P)/FAD-dependent oxidoreductase [Oscillatoria sp. PMC 1068.18]